MSDAPNEWLFSYGTLRDPDVQRELFGRVVAGAPDALAGFVTEPIELAEADGGKWMHFIAVRGRAADRIEGAALLLTLTELAICDGYEPEPYVRIELPLASGKRAWAYVHRDKS